MTDKQSNDPSTIRWNAIINSGFLFQQYVEKIVKQARSSWGVYCTEHSWIDPENGEQRFIDIVLKYGRMRIVIECKRFTDSDFIFLVPNSDQKYVYTARVCTYDNLRFENNADLSWIPVVHKIREGYSDSMYALIRRSGKQGTDDTLEKIAGPLLRSTEGLALQEAVSSRKSNGGYFMAYIPAIVTNAALFVCRYDMDKITKDGEVPYPDTTFESTPYVQFSKSLSTSLKPLPGTGDLDEVNARGKRTVFVVNVEYLTEWLSKITEIGFPSL